MQDSFRQVKEIIDGSDYFLLVFESDFHVQTDTKSLCCHFLIRWIQANDKRGKLLLECELKFKSSKT
jgi:hypothetical protein